MSEKVTRPTNHDCTHWWEIEIANGPTSQGICKFCGETRDFFNSFDFLYMKIGRRIIGDTSRREKVK